MSAGDVNLLDLPQQLANTLGIPLFAGQVLATMIILMVFLLPILYLTRGKSVISVLLGGFLALSFCIAVGWLPFWIMLVLVLMVAAMWSGKIKEWVT